MRLMKGKNLALMLIGWISSEILLFYLVLHALGFFLTLALGLLTSLIGLTDLKKLLNFLKINKNIKINNALHLLRCVLKRYLNKKINNFNYKYKPIINEIKTFMNLTPKK